MIEAWMARSADKSRIRLQLEPFDPVLWIGWSIRHGGITDEEWHTLGSTTDEVEMERLHQDIWARWAPEG